MAQNEATALVTAALFAKAVESSPSKGPTSVPQTVPPGLTLLKFWEGRDQEAVFRPPQSAVEVDSRLTNALHRYVIDPALVPQTLQPLRLGHDFIPRTKRILEQRVALEGLRLKLKTEGIEVRRLVDKQGARSSSAPPQPESSNATTALIPTEAEEENDNASNGVVSSSITKESSSASLGSGSNGLLRHPDLVAWDKYESDTLKYIEEQHKALDSHTAALKEAYALWRREVDFFRSGGGI